MKIASCIRDRQVLGLCLVEEQGVKPLDTILDMHFENMVDLIEKWDEIQGELIKKAALVPLIPMTEITFDTPVKVPKRNILCVGKNYLEHAKELEGQTSSISGVPEYPIFFSKMVYETIGTEDAIEFDKSVTDSVDYEVELAVIIGKKIKNITEEEAEAAIFGYTIGNDVSARNLQVEHVQWYKGKSLDTFMPLGPVVVTKETFAYPPKLKIECWVNGEVRQSDYTDNLIFSLSRLISTLSQGMTLLPGDVILTGTPSGVGMGFKPPKYLKNGDEVICKIEGIGTLKNHVVTKN
jgi:2-keto-4-pentenoate hydratase/2-oxohepta-3-ene-1,7-dioic acid hydratase in catechol pathway